VAHDLERGLEEEFADLLRPRTRMSASHLDTLVEEMASDDSDQETPGTAKQHQAQ
jgi:hypothetical protein